SAGGDPAHGVVGLVAQSTEDGGGGDRSAVNAGRAVHVHLRALILQRLEGELRRALEKLGRLGLEIVIGGVPQDFDAGIGGELAVVKLDLQVDDMGESQAGQRGHGFGRPDAATDGEAAVEDVGDLHGAFAALLSHANGRAHLRHARPLQLVAVPLPRVAVNGGRLFSGRPFLPASSPLWPLWLSWRALSWRRVCWRPWRPRAPAFWPRPFSRLWGRPF